MGFDFEDKSIFFTLNGKFLGVAFENGIDPMADRPILDMNLGGLHPAVALHEPGDSARFNLGRERFAFDLEALALARQRSRAAAAAAAAAAHAMEVEGPSEMQ